MLVTGPIFVRTLCFGNDTVYSIRLCWWREKQAMQTYQIPFVNKLRGCTNFLENVKWLKKIKCPNHSVLENSVIVALKFLYFAVIIQSGAKLKNVIEWTTVATFKCLTNVRLAHNDGKWTDSILDKIKKIECIQQFLSHSIFLQYQQHFFFVWFTLKTSK